MDKCCHIPHFETGIPFSGTSQQMITCNVICLKCLLPLFFFFVMKLKFSVWKKCNFTLRANIWNSTNAHIKCLYEGWTSTSKQYRPGGEQLESTFTEKDLKFVVNLLNMHQQHIPGARKASSILVCSRRNLFISINHL